MSITHSGYYVTGRQQREIWIKGIKLLACGSLLAHEPHTSGLHYMSVIKVRFRSVCDLPLCYFHKVLLAAVLISHLHKRD